MKKTVNLLRRKTKKLQNSIKKIPYAQDSS